MCTRFPSPPHWWPHHLTRRTSEGPAGERSSVSAFPLVSPSSQFSASEPRPDRSKAKPTCPPEPHLRLYFATKEAGPCRLPQSAPEDLPESGLWARDLEPSRLPTHQRASWPHRGVSGVWVSLGLRKPRQDSLAARGGIVSGGQSTANLRQGA